MISTMDDFQLIRNSSFKSASLLYVAVAICSALLFYKYCFPRHTLPLPPGPVPLPVIGNLHQLTTGDPFDKIKQWHQKYGPLISFRVGQRTVIVIGSYKIAHDLLDKQSAVYSSRPEFHIASKHLGRHMFIPVMPYGGKFNAHRRVITSLLTPVMVKRYQYVQDIESKQAVHELLASHDFSLIFERFVTSLQFTLAYGMQLESVERPEISEMMHIAHALVDGVKSNAITSVVELFPVLDRLPQFLAPWKRFWGERYHRTTKFYLRSLGYSRTEHKLSSWTWTREVMSAQQHVGEMSVTEIAHLVGTVNAAGVESTPKTLRTAIKALLVNPTVTQRAQQEIDDVVGSDRLPGFEDRPRMPYIDALIKEIFRWQPLMPLSMPHSTDTDQEYMGYRIPKGSVIMPNNDEMVYDSNICQEPREFKPERWLETPDLQVFGPFGHGRRKCPGEYLAMNSLFIIISRILWGYNIKYAVRDGRTVEVGVWDIDNKFTSAPAPFEAFFEVRDEHRRRIIEQEFSSIEKDVSQILRKVAP
jgi:cytochrome P450